MFSYIDIYYVHWYMPGKLGYIAKHHEIDSHSVFSGLMLC